MSSAFDAVAHNLAYMEGDLIASTDTPPYVLVTDGTSSVSYAAGHLDAITGVVTNANNLVGEPNLDESAGVFREKWTLRIAGASPAINAGLGSVAPPEDIDGNTRGSAPDIGTHEARP